MCIRDRGNIQLFQASAPPLGILPNTEYPAFSFFLGDGVIYLYSDGLSESKNGEGHLLGQSGLTELIDAVVYVEPSDRVGAIIKQRNAMGYVSNDDITLLVVDQRR